MPPKAPMQPVSGAKTLFLLSFPPPPTLEPSSLPLEVQPANVRNQDYSQDGRVFLQLHWIGWNGWKKKSERGILLIPLRRTGSVYGGRHMTDRPADVIARERRTDEISFGERRRNELCFTLITEAQYKRFSESSTRTKGKLTRMKERKRRKFNRIQSIFYY